VTLVFADGEWGVAIRKKPAARPVGPLPFFSLRQM